jgi:CheY-like chemotaxis protein
MIKVRKLANDGLITGGRRQFDVVLTDVIMPVMDGIQV